MKLASLIMIAACVGCHEVETRGTGTDRTHSDPIWTTVCDEDCDDGGDDVEPSPTPSPTSGPKTDGDPDSGPETESEGVTEATVAHPDRLIGVWRLGPLTVTYSRTSFTTSINDSENTVEIVEFVDRGTKLGLVLGDGRRCEILFESLDVFVAACERERFPDAGWETLEPANRYTRVR